MKNLLIIIFGLGFVLNNSGFAFAYDFYSDPYFGIDLQYNKLKFDPNDGARFNKWAPQTNHYLGMQFHDNFAVEFGYEASKRMQNTETLATDEKFLGQIVRGVGVGPGVGLNDKDVHVLSLKSHAFNANVLGLYRLYNHLEVLGNIGLSYVNVSANDIQIARNGVFTNEIKQLASKNKTVLTMGGGFKWCYNPNLAFRAVANWENKNKLNRLEYSDPLVPANSLYSNFKNNAKLSVGAIFNFN